MSDALAKTRQAMVEDFYAAGIPAITVRQPWLWCITEAKRIRAAGLEPKATENRGRRINKQTYLGYDFALHASLTWSPEGASDERVRRVWRGVLGPVPPLVPDAVPLGAVVAVATLLGVHQAPEEPAPMCCRPWGERSHSGRRAWHLLFGYARRLPEPVPCRGQQAMPWRLRPEVTEQVTAQLKEAK